MQAASNSFDEASNESVFHSNALVQHFSQEDTIQEGAENEEEGEEEEQEQEEGSRLHDEEESNIPIGYDKPEGYFYLGSEGNIEETDPDEEEKAASIHESLTS